jgi:S-DNA-T family DNA segregation ATPase FtsK/SpoIIIE
MRYGLFISSQHRQQPTGSLLFSCISEVFLGILKAMALKKKINGNGKKKPEIRDRAEGVRSAGWRIGQDLKPETKKSVFAVVLFLVTALLVLSYIGQGGSAGALAFRMFDFLLGKGYFFAPLILVLVGFSLLFSGPKQVLGVTLIGGVLLLVSCLTGFHVVFGAGTGGFIGLMLGALFLKLFDYWASVILVAGLLVISSLLIFDMPLLWKFRHGEEGDAESPEETDSALDEEDKEVTGVKAMLAGMQEKLAAALEKKTEEPAPVSQSTAISDPKPDEASISLRKFAKKFVYTKPPLELLQGDKGKPSSGDIRANANIIKRTLENFGIPVEMGEVSIGPTVTQYTLRPAEGGKACPYHCFAQ